MKDYFKKLKQLFKLRDLCFALLLFAIIIGIAFCKGENLMNLTFGEDSVDVVSTRYSMNIPYNIVESIELAEICEDDQLVNGVADIAIRTGVWNSEVWGEYYACVDLQSTTCIVVYLNDGRVFVFNDSGDEKTAEAFEQLQSRLNAQ